MQAKLAARQEYEAKLRDLDLRVAFEEEAVRLAAQRQQEAEEVCGARLHTVLSSHRLPQFPVPTDSPTLCVHATDSLAL